MEGIQKEIDRRQFHTCAVQKGRSTFRKHFEARSPSLVSDSGNIQRLVMVSLISEPSRLLKVVRVSFPNV